MIYVPVYPDIHGRYWVATNARNHTRLGETRMTNPCNCKAEHWQAHADSCPQAKQNKGAAMTIDLLKLLRGQRVDGRTVDEVMALAADEIQALRVERHQLQNDLTAAGLENERLRGEAEVADEQLAQLRGFAEAHKTCRGSDEPNPPRWPGWSEGKPEPGANPFDRAAIMGDPGNRRISMSFETQAQYEAALALLDMADEPAEKSSERQLCIQCTGWMDEHRHSSSGEVGI